MTEAHYLTLLGFVMLILARQLRSGSTFDKTMSVVLNVTALFVFVFALVSG